MLAGGFSRLEKKMTEIEVFGADWCPLTARAREHLDDLNVPYRYINIEEDPTAAAWVREQSAGKEKIPTIKIGGTVLIEPSNEELDRELARAEATVRS